MKQQTSAWEWIANKFGKTVQTVEEEVQEEALLLERNVLMKELELIKKEHELAGKRACLDHMANWLKKRSTVVEDANT